MSALERNHPEELGSCSGIEEHKPDEATDFDAMVPNFDPSKFEAALRFLKQREKVDDE